MEWNRNQKRPMCDVPPSLRGLTIFTSSYKFTMQLERRADARVGPSRGRALLRGNLGQVYFSQPDRNEIETFEL